MSGQQQTIYFREPRHTLGLLWHAFDARRQAPDTYMPSTGAGGDEVEKAIKKLADAVGGETVMEDANFNQAIYTALNEAYRSSQAVIGQTRAFHTIQVTWKPWVGPPPVSEMDTCVYYEYETDPEDADSGKK